MAPRTSRIATSLMMDTELSCLREKVRLEIYSFDYKTFVLFHLLSELDDGLWAIHIAVWMGITHHDQDNGFCLSNKQASPFRCRVPIL